MPYTPDPNSVAITDVGVYRSNLEHIRSFIGPDVALMAVIKSNAYGHGMIECARAALSAKAAMLGVCFASEGLELRRNGITAPILALGPESVENLPTMIENDITIALNSFDMLNALSGILADRSATCRVHVKVDTGMGRIGVPVDQAVELVEAAENTVGIRVEGIFTHFPVSDEDRDEYSRAQIETFAGLLDTLEKRESRPPIAHMCNSSGTLKFPEAHFDMVRPGIMTYGLEPHPGAWETLKLNPVLSWTARITFVKNTPENFAVSYGGTFVTKRPSRLATVPVGYGHGYSRALSGKGSGIVNGVRVPIAGRICMDQTVFDVTEAGTVKPGDIITLIGKDGDAWVSVEEHAEIGGTISHEITTGITGRVSRTVIETS